MNDHCFGETVKKLLVEKDLTQKRLAECLEIDPVTLNRYIKGERRIPEPTLRKVAEFFNVEPQQLLGTNDPDVLIWHYHRLEGAYIDMDKGFEQALIQGRDKSFIYPILRKYYSKGEMQELVDSYDAAEPMDKEVWPEDALSSNKDPEYRKTGAKSKTCGPNHLNLAPPESLFSGANTEEKKELLEMYFSRLKEIAEIASR